MSLLTIYPENRADVGISFESCKGIARSLEIIDVLFERWEAKASLTIDSSQEEVISAYRKSIDYLMHCYNFQSVDVISLHPEHPNREVLRKKFLDEHTHSEFEVRFFVEGQGVFYIHADRKVYRVLCESGDLISIPAHMPHWFDMGPRPHFKCIRLFTNPKGWIAQFTGSKIAEMFPRFGE